MDLAEGPRLTFEVSGAHAGPIVLLLRPLHEPIEGLASFRAALASRARVIDLDGAPPLDLKGQGGPSFSSRALGHSALAVLEQLGVSRAHVVGLAKGAMAATWLAIDAPDRVARVCLIAAPATARALLRVHRPLAPVLFLVGDREELPEEALRRALADARAAPRWGPLPEAAEPPIWEGRTRAQRSEHAGGGGHLLSRVGFDRARVDSDPSGLEGDLSHPLAAAHRSLRFFLDAEAVTIRVRGR